MDKRLKQVQPQKHTGEGADEAMFLSLSLAVGEIQVQAAGRLYRLTAVSGIHNDGLVWARSDGSHTFWLITKWFCHSKTMWQFLYVKHTPVMWLSNPIPRYLPKRNENYVYAKIHTSVFTMSIYVHQKPETQISYIGLVDRHTAVNNGKCHSVSKGTNRCHTQGWDDLSSTLREGSQSRKIPACVWLSLLSLWQTPENNQPKGRRCLLGLLVSEVAVHGQLAPLQNFMAEARGGGSCSPNGREEARRRIGGVQVSSTPSRTHLNDLLLHQGSPPKFPPPPGAPSAGDHASNTQAWRAMWDLSTTVWFSSHGILEKATAQWWADHGGQGLRGQGSKTLKRQNTEVSETMGCSVSWLWWGSTSLSSVRIHSSYTKNASFTVY